jgi:predicted RecA/RadA family phage recombinase
MTQALPLYGPGFVKHTLAADATPGDVIVHGERIGIVRPLNPSETDSGDIVALGTDGVYNMTWKSTDTPSDGDIAYWDDTNNECTTTAGSHKKAGLAVGDKASGVTLHPVDINKRQ